MKRVLVVVACVVLSACKSGEPLPVADAGRKKVTLLYVMNCVHAAQIRTYWKVGHEKREFPTARHDYWVGVKAQLFNKHVDKAALRRMELASINQSKHDAKLNLSQPEKIKKYWAILERCAEREAPLAQLEVDYESELL